MLCMLSRASKVVHLVVAISAVLVVSVCVGVGVYGSVLAVT